MSNPFKFRTQSLKPFQRDARPVWLVHYYDTDGIRQTASLGTKNKTEAKSICLDLESIANNPATWKLAPDSPLIAGLSPKALQIWFGLAEAVQKYNATYARAHDKHTSTQVKRILDGFIEYVGSETLIGKIEGKRVSEYVGGTLDKKTHEMVGGLKNAKTGKALSANSKRKLQAYISAFFSWSVIEYELFQNPMIHAHAIKGAGGDSEVVAIKEFEHLTTLLRALEPYPYWRAWVAFATLAGPRFEEQTLAKITDLAPDFSVITIYGKKTKRFRRTPIEQNLLKPILKEYVAKHRPNIEGCELLFPSVTAGLGHGSKDNVWRSSTFHKIWKGGYNPKSDDNGKIKWKGSRIEGISEKIRASVQNPPPCFEFGPKEWRHCGATAMGHTGVSSLRISQWVGNSEAICRKHYLAMTGTVNWPLKYLGVAE